MPGDVQFSIEIAYFFANECRTIYRWFAKLLLI